MQVLSFSPSKLEVFRKHIHEEYNGWFTKEKVIEQIKGEQKVSFKANMGTAIHEILEHGYEPYYDKEKDLYVVKVENRDGTEPDIFKFNHNDIIPVINYYETHLMAVNEIPLLMELKVGKYLVKMRMRVDQMIGTAVTDHKTSDKEPKVDEYERSVQWKLYLMATKATLFNYNHFQYREPKRGPEAGKLIITNREWQFYPYPEMESDVIGLCQRFINFCEIEGLFDYIQFKEPKVFLT